MVPVGLSPVVHGADLCVVILSLAFLPFLLYLVLPNKLLASLSKRPLAFLTVAHRMGKIVLSSFLDADTSDIEKCLLKTVCNSAHPAGVPD